MELARCVFIFEMHIKILGIIIAWQRRWVLTLILGHRIKFMQTGLNPNHGSKAKIGIFSMRKIIIVYIAIKIAITFLLLFFQNQQKKVSCMILYFLECSRGACISDFDVLFNFYFAKN